MKLMVSIDPITGLLLIFKMIDAMGKIGPAYKEGNINVKRVGSTLVEVPQLAAVPCVESTLVARSLSLWLKPSIISIFLDSKEALLSLSCATGLCI